jgi:hypothetical protein
MDELLQGFIIHPLLEKVTFERVQIDYRTMTLLYRMLVAKRSMRQLCMIGTDMDYRNSRFLLARIKRHEAECDHLTHICFFGCPYDRPSQESEEDRQWKDDIDNELDKITDGNVNKSVKEFIDTIVSRDDNDSTTKHSHLQFITDVLHANEKDFNDKGNEINPPSYLYALIKAKPEFMKRGIKRGIDERSENTESNKMAKFN